MHFIYEDWDLIPNTVRGRIEVEYERNGDIIGHDMGEAKAKALAAEMQEKEPDAGWEAMNGDGE